MIGLPAVPSPAVSMRDGVPMCTVDMLGHVSLQFLYIYVSALTPPDSHVLTGTQAVAKCATTL